MYPEATKDVVVDTAMENVAALADVLHTVIVEMTAAVAAGQVYSVSAVPIVPVDAIAPRRLYTSAMILPFVRYESYIPPSSMEEIFEEPPPDDA